MSYLSKNKDTGVTQVGYLRIIGSLICLMTCTRPNIAYTVSKLTRYTSNPSDDHWKWIVRVLRCLRYTRDCGLHYTKYPAIVEVYSDTNLIFDIKDSKSISRFIFILGSVTILWKSSK